MKINLTDILKSTVLLEGRKEDVIKKYGEENTEMIKKLSENDPSGNNKYLAWMAKQSLVNGASYSDIVSYTRDFHTHLPRIANKDINSYKTLADMSSVITDAKVKAEEKAADKEADKVFESDVVTIYAPLTVRASCKYGAGSKWCITSKGGTTERPTYNTYFDSYSKDATFYFFLRKDVTQSQDSRGYKWALQFSHNGNLTWWDAQDSSHSDTPNFVTDDMMSAVKAYNVDAVKNKLARQIKAFVSNPTVSKYKDFRDHITPEQRTSVINKIIKSGELNNTTFKTLVADLTDDQKTKFIDSYVVGKVTASDYKSMKTHLSEEHIYKLIQTNPSLLNNSEIVREVDGMFDDNRKNELTKTIDGKQITNTDSKVLIRKWGMSEEERARHGQSSFYVFLSDSDNFITKLVKVDPLNPESYRTINMLKLNKSLKPGITLYGIKTTATVLDDFIDKSSEGMSEDIMNMVKQEARKIE